MIQLLDKAVGQVLRFLDTSDYMGDYCTAAMDLISHPQISDHFTLEFDIIFDDGDRFDFTGLSDDGQVQFRVASLSSYTRLDAYDSTKGVVTCGYPNFSFWHSLAVEIDQVSGTFSVLLDEAPTSCTDLTFIQDADPVTEVEWISGGGPAGATSTTFVDNILAYTTSD